MLFYITKPLHIINFAPKGNEVIIKKCLKRKTNYNLVLNDFCFKFLLILVKSKKMKHYFNEYRFSNLNLSKSFTRIKRESKSRRHCSDDRVCQYCARRRLTQTVTQLPALFLYIGLSQARVS